MSVPGGEVVALIARNSEAWSRYVGPAAPRRLARRGGGLFGRQCFVDEHDRDTVSNRIVALALATDQVVAYPRHGLFIQRTGKDGQQLRINFAAQLRRLGWFWHSRRRPAFGRTIGRALSPPPGSAASSERK